jgi:hypothetical protein
VVRGWRKPHNEKLTTLKKYRRDGLNMQHARRRRRRRKGVHIVGKPEG